MNCDRNCNTLCPNLIISTSVSVVTVNGVDTLVVNIPSDSYRNGCRYCIVVAQSIPTTATIGMPVAVSIGGVTTTVYPLTNKCCVQVTACAIRTRKRYPVYVSTTATGGTFKVLCGLSCAPNNALESLPVPTVTPATAAVNASARGTASTAKTKSVNNMTVTAQKVTVAKEVKANE